MKKFIDLGLSPKVMKAINDVGYDTPTPIQSEAIPHALEGRDVLGIAQTGTGKTAGFTLPMIHKLARGRARARMPRSLVLAPTRELAAQVAENFEQYAKYVKLDMALLIGGVSFKDQDRLIDRGVDVLIATPGRLLDHFERGKLLLTGIEIMVVDEADRMLDMGFIPDIRKIYNATSKKQQMLMFSATFDNPIQKIAQEFLNDPVTISIKPDVSGHKDIKQIAYFSDNQSHKQQLLDHFIKNDDLTQGIIFTATKRMADQLSDQLYHLDIASSALHGDMSQGARNKAINRFKRNQTKILVATDLASRGIDVQNISHVFNYDMPRFAEDYIHRIGRTGRANKKGLAISLVSPTDREFLRKIEKFTKLKIEIASVKGLEPTAINEEINPKRKRRKRPFVKKGKVFKNKTNAKKRIRSKSNFNKTNQSVLNH